MTKMIEYNVFYHIMKELKFTIECLGRYKTKTDLTTFLQYLSKIFTAKAAVSSQHSSTPPLSSILSLSDLTIHVE